jgi:DnaJ-class molecular chaperone
VRIVDDMEAISKRLREIELNKNEQRKVTNGVGPRVRCEHCEGTGWGDCLLKSGVCGFCLGDGFIDAASF